MLFCELSDASAVWLCGSIANNTEALVAVSGISTFLLFLPIPGFFSLSFLNEEQLIAVSNRVTLDVLTMPYHFRRHHHHHHLSWPMNSLVERRRLEMHLVPTGLFIYYALDA